MPTYTAASSSPQHVERFAQMPRITTGYLPQAASTIMEEGRMKAISNYRRKRFAYIVNLLGPDYICNGAAIDLYLPPTIERSAQGFHFLCKELHTELAFRLKSQQV